MLETIASYLSGIWIILMLIAGYKRNEIWMGIFMLLYIVSMALWGISWLNKKYEVKRKRAAAKKKDESQEQPSPQPTQQPFQPTNERRSETIFSVTNAEGILNVSADGISVQWSSGDPATMEGFTIRCSAMDGNVYCFKASPAQYTSSGLRFVLHQKGWPEWATDALAGWNGIGRITRDTAAPDAPGKIFWENGGDPSRLYSILWFEKTEEQWSLSYCGSDLPNLSWPLPDATDNDIADHLQLSTIVFWQHPTIRELHWTHSDKKKTPPPKSEKAEEKSNPSAAKPESPKPASKHSLTHYTMSEAEQLKCSRMLEQLDKDLSSVNADRSFLDRRHYGTGKPRFGYAEKYGYYVVIQPERASEIVPFVEKDERDFRRIMLREAAEAGCGTGLFLTLTHTWGVRAEHGEEKLEVSYQEKAFHFLLTSTYWNDAGPGDPPRITTRLLRTATHVDFLRFTLSGFLFHMETMHSLPGWAVYRLSREKVFTSLFHPGTDIEQERCIYWINGGNAQEKWVVWFRQMNGTWHACANVRTPEVRIDKTTPLPMAGHRAIAELLTLDPFIYINQPDIENWCLEDRSARVILFRKTNSPSPDERRTILFEIDKRNGALYHFEAHSRYSDGDRGPVTIDRGSTTRPAFYQELISADSHFRGMTLRNWRSYLPKAPFTPEEQKKYEDRIYQFHQDVQRGGTPPEMAAANRDIVLIDERPVPAETAEHTNERKKQTKPVTVYQHKRTSFYDEESLVQLGDTSVFTTFDTPNAGDHSAYPLPAFMLLAGFTRGGLLTWLKSQSCVISFPPKDLKDDTVLRPHAVLIMDEELPISGFGKKVETIDVHFYTGSNCLSKAAVYSMKDGTEWLLSSSEWRDAFDPKNDTRIDFAIRHIHEGSMTERSKTTLKRTAERLPSLWQARTLFTSLCLYRDDIPPSEYGEEVQQLHDWVSSVGHDSQSWDCRVHTTSLHQKDGFHYVIDRALWIDGTTQEHRWATTVAQLKPGVESTITADKIHEAIGRLPHRNPNAW